VCVQVVTDSPDSLPRREWRTLAETYFATRP
jgi:hypothetical protein